jgi:Ca2+/Na+ antiporter
VTAKTALFNYLKEKQQKRTKSNYFPRKKKGRKTAVPPNFHVCPVFVLFPVFICLIFMSELTRLIGLCVFVLFCVFVVVLFDPE